MGGGDKTRDSLTSKCFDSISPNDYGVKRLRKHPETLPTYTDLRAIGMCSLWVSHSADLGAQDRRVI